MKRNSKQFLALFMAVAMSVTPVSYAYAEDNLTSGMESTSEGQQSVEEAGQEENVEDLTEQPAADPDSQEEKTTGQGMNESGNAGEELSGSEEQKAECRSRTVF